MSPLSLKPGPNHWAIFQLIFPVRHFQPALSDQQLVHPRLLPRYRSSQAKHSFGDFGSELRTAQFNRPACPSTFALQSPKTDGTRHDLYPRPIWCQTHLNRV